MKCDLCSGKFYISAADIKRKVVFFKCTQCENEGVIHITSLVIYGPPKKGGIQPVALGFIKGEK